MRLSKTSNINTTSNTSNKNIPIGIVNGYIYSNLHVAACAAAYCLSFWQLRMIPLEDSYLFFIFCATLFIYIIHRYVGYGKMVRRGSPLNYRYSVIGRLLPVYPILFVLSGIGCIYYAFNHLDITFIQSLSLPMLLSALYVLPIFPRGKRLRDYDFVKIFVIGICWSWYSTWFLYGNGHFVWYFISQFIFILGITIPFDIRDITLDQRDNVQTIATLLRPKKSKALSVLLIAMAILIQIVLNPTLSFGISHIALGSLLTVLIFSNFLYRDDRYISGILEASILFKGFLCYLTLS